MHGHCECFVLECRLQFGTGSCWRRRPGGSVQDLASLEGCRGVTWVWNGIVSVTFCWGHGREEGWHEDCLC